jgi:hypothetical protein
MQIKVCALLLSYGRNELIEVAGVSSFGIVGERAALGACGKHTYAIDRKDFFWLTLTPGTLVGQCCMCIYTPGSANFFLKTYYFP